MGTLFRNGLKLKGVKTLVAPLHTQILGWDGNDGNIAASKHKISAHSFSLIFL